MSKLRDRGYTIRAAAQLVGMHEQSLRSYERRGLIQPQRSAGNIRLFNDDDIEQIRLIKRMVDDLGVNLAGVEVIIRMRRQLVQTQQALAEAEREIARLRGMA
jgi:MerR family transcriptional regulator/heat shock protein HspR